MINDHATKVTTFDRLCAIVDGGHVAAMSGAEAKALLVMLRHADYLTGELYPSMETIARKAGKGNVHRARQSVQALAKRGIVRNINPSNGRSTVTRCIDLPAPVMPIGSDRAENRTGTESDPDGFGSPTGTVCDTNRAGFRTPTGPESGPRTNQNTSGNKSGNTSGNTSAGLFRDERPAGSTVSGTKEQKATPAAVVYPPALDTPEFRACWLDYVNYRKAYKLKALLPISINRKFAQFMEWGGAAVAMFAIHDAIANSYQGIFKPDRPAERKSHAQPKPSASARGEFEERVDVDALLRS